MAIARERRPQQRRAWAQLALLFVPVVVPVLLAVALLAFFVDQDSEPGGLGEPPSGLVPGAVTVTGWHRQDTSLVPDGFGRPDPGHASPQALLDSMVAAARRTPDGASWITGSIISADADAAKVRIYLPVTGHSQAFVAAEHVMELSVKSDGWFVEDANVRFHCRRAVRDGFCG